MTENLATGMAALAAVLLGADEVGDVLDDVADIVAVMLPPTPSAELKVAIGFEAAQGFSAGARVVRAAFVSGVPTPWRTPRYRDRPDWVVRTDADDVHPYLKYLSSQGITAVGCYRLATAEDPDALLAVHTTGTAGFDTSGVRAMVETAEHLRVLLLAAATAARQTRLNAQLYAALESRSAIDQALGIIMGRRRCGYDEAFALLREQSQRANRKVADLAVEIVGRVSGERPGPVRFEQPRRGRSLTRDS